MIKHNRIFDVINRFPVMVDNHHLFSLREQFGTVCEILFVGIDNNYQGILINKLKWKWVNDYALPICMVLGMALAIPFTAWLGGKI